jgi:hypothetical protein
MTTMNPILHFRTGDPSVCLHRLNSHLRERYRLERVRIHLFSNGRTLYSVRLVRSMWSYFAYVLETVWSLPQRLSADNRKLV